jgi:hypothetical protein
MSNQSTQGGVIMDGEFLPFTYSLYENGFEILDEYMAHVELDNSIRVLTIDMIIDNQSFETITELISYIYGLD